MTIISNNHDFIFVHIPRCGGSSVEISFEPHISWGDFVVGSSPRGRRLHHVFAELYGIDKHNTAMELRKIIGAEKFDRQEIVATVREPLKIVESFYRFSKSIHTSYAGEFLQEVPGQNIDLAKAYVKKLIRDGRLQGDPRFSMVANPIGTITLGIVSDSFGEFVKRAADDRWRNYLSEYTHDASGKMLVQRILKLEKPQDIEAYFRSKVGSGFKLGHENASEKTETVWPEGWKANYYDLTKVEYELFGYKS